jgi:Polyprenyl synthetase
LPLLLLQQESCCLLLLLLLGQQAQSGALNSLCFTMVRNAVAQLPSVPLPDAQHTAVRSLQAMLPVVYVLLAFSLVLGIASTFFKGRSKQSLLNIYLLGAAALSIHALAQTDELDRVLQHVWRIFLSLSDAAKVYYTVTCLALLHVFSKMYGSVLGARDTAVMTAPRLVNRDDTARSPGAEYPDNLDWEGDVKGSFAALCDILIAEVLIDLKEEYEGIPEQIDWIARMLEYNVKGGKMNRGIGVIDVQRAFAAQAGRDLSDIEYCRASVLGWCIEWLQSCFLVADDVMDESVTRRGNPCWYRLPDVKQIAINDSMIIDSLVYKVLKRHFE